MRCPGRPERPDGTSVAVAVVLFGTFATVSATFSAYVRFRRVAEPG